MPTRYPPSRAPPIISSLCPCLFLIPLSLVLSFLRRSCPVNVSQPPECLLSCVYGSIITSVACDQVGSVVMARSVSSVFRKQQRNRRQEKNKVRRRYLLEEEEEKKWWRRKRRSRKRRSCIFVRLGSLRDNSCYLLRPIKSKST